jgi:hypothetical protein
MIRIATAAAFAVCLTAAAQAQEPKAGSVAPPTPGSVLFAPEQERIIGRYVAEHAEPDAAPATPLREGATVSEDVALESFPSDVYTFVPMARSYRYVYTHAGLAMVDPTSRMVVRVIEAR